MPAKDQETRFTMDRVASATLIVILITALAVALWQMREVVFLAFAGLLLAVIFHHVALAVSKRTGLSRGWSLTVLALLLVGLNVLAVVLAGPLINQQFGQLADGLPKALSELEEYLKGTRWGSYVLRQIEDRPQQGDMNLIQVLTGTFSTLVGTLVNLFVVFSLTAFIVANPKTYRQGALKLFPKSVQGRVTRFFDTTGEGLYRWVLGQLLAMSFVAILTSLGLWWLGVSYPIALGIIMGILDFIPYLGPYLGGAPAVIVAFADSPQTAIWVVVLIVVVQTLEGNLILPKAQQQATSLPPALIILTVLAFGSLFGILGIMLATPLLLVIFTAVRIFYVEGALGHELDDEET